MLKATMMGPTVRQATPWETTLCAPTCATDYPSGPSSTDTRSGWGMVVSVHNSSVSRGQVGRGGREGSIRRAALRAAEAKGGKEGLEGKNLRRRRQKAGGAEDKG